MGARIGVLLSVAIAATVLLSGASIGSTPPADAVASAGACPEPAPPSSPTPHPTHRPTPDPSFARGVNVSFFDGSPSYPALAKAGVDFVYARATSGLTYHDPTHRRSLLRGLRNGMVVGSFHFFDYRRDGAAQARFFVASVRADGGFDRRLPPVLDLECYPAWGAGDRATTIEGIRDFLEETYRLTGLVPAMYTGRWTWREWLGDPTGFGDARLWIACWVCGPEPRPATGWTDWRVWQLGAWAVPGVPRKIGANVFHGTERELRADVRHGPRLMGGAPVTTDPTVRVDLSGTDGVAWQARVGDGPWSAWAPWAPTVRVELPGRAGTQRISIRLRDAAGTRAPARWLTVVVGQAVQAAQAEVVPAGTFGATSAGSSPRGR